MLVTRGVLDWQFTISSKSACSFSAMPRCRKNCGLRPIEAALFERVLALGRERGYELSEHDLRAVVNANRRAWLERWIHQ